MVAVQQLLDPQARDPQLRAFAYLQARFVKGARSAIDCLQPLVAAENLIRAGARLSIG